jgi:hypothetical protein
MLNINTQSDLNNIATSGLDQRLAIYGYINFVAQAENLNLSALNCWWYEGLNDTFEGQKLDILTEEIVSFLINLDNYLLKYKLDEIIPKNYYSRR